MDAKSKVESAVKKSDDKKSDDVDKKNENVQLQVVDNGDVNVEIVNANQDDKDVKDMLDNPVDNEKEREKEMDVSEKIMNDFANIVLESGLQRKESDVKKEN